MDLKKHGVIITGGSSGIGAETARILSEEVGFHNVFILDKKSPNYELKNLNFLQCDLSRPNDVENCINNIGKDFKIGYLFSNAGVIEFGKITEMDIDKINEIISNNLLSTIYALKYTLPHMIKNNFGKIVLNGSDQSFIGKKSMSIYGSTKGAIAQLCKSTALDYAKNNINVNCVCPGTIETENYFNLIKQINANIDPLQIKEAAIKSIPLRRNGTPRDVANVVEFLFSEKSSYLTGTTISIDGGYTAQ